MLPAPASKHVKESASPDRRDIALICAAGKITNVSGTTGGWVDPAAQIGQDDRNIAVTARENLKRLEGETFYTELQDMYRDQKGKKTTAVHDRIGNSRNSTLIVELPGADTVKEEERETGGNGVVVDRAYDSDSSDGGIALSLSDLETELWAVIKREDS